MANGDYVALDLQASPAPRAADDPPVVYLSHEGEEAGPLADSFTGFLAAWECLAYLGPELWLLDGLRAADGRLAPGSAAAGRLRVLLGA